MSDNYGRSLPPFNLHRLLRTDEHNEHKTQSDHSKSQKLPTMSDHSYKQKHPTEWTDQEKTKHINDTARSLASRVGIKHETLLNNLTGNDVLGIGLRACSKAIKFTGLEPDMPETASVQDLVESLRQRLAGGKLPPLSIDRNEENRERHLTSFRKAIDKDEKLKDDCDKADKATLAAAKFVIGFMAESDYLDRLAGGSRSTRPSYELRKNCQPALDALKALCESNASMWLDPSPDHTPPGTPS